MEMLFLKLFIFSGILSLIIMSIVYIVERNIMNCIISIALVIILSLIWICLFQVRNDIKSLEKPNEVNQRENSVSETANTE